MKTTAYVTHSDCSLHDPGWAHPEHQGRLPAIARAVYRDMLVLFEPLLEVEAVPATEADLRLAHTAEYVQRVQERVAGAAAEGKSLALEAGTVVSAGSWAAATAAVGAAITAATAVLRADVRNAFCAVRPPGHGVGPSSAGGHGIFNAVAVTALALLERHELKRLLVVDWGASPGTGTLEILSTDPRIEFVGIARGYSSPRPERHHLFSLPAGAGAAQFVAALRAGLDRVAARPGPDFILLSLGCDALASDPLGAFRLDPADYFLLTEILRGHADAVCGGRLVTVLEEGYDASGTGAAVVHHLRALAGLPPP